LEAGKATAGRPRVVFGDCRRGQHRKSNIGLTLDYDQAAAMSLVDEQIAGEIGRVRWTVLRKLQRIRDVWRQMARECGDW
jgi:hypothetical protein